MRALPACLALGLAACAAAAADGASRPIRVATLSTVLTEVAREVGGDQVTVTGLVGPGVDPHTFSPSPADVCLLVDADVVLASGLNLEPYLDHLAANVGLRGRVLAVGDALPSVISLSGAGGREEKDPHWWHSIDDMLLVVDLVRMEFSRLRPESAGAFARNAGAYSARLRALKEWVAAQMAGLSAGRRQLVTSHDAFAYFARDYGFTVHAMSGLSTGSEADARRVAGLIDLIRRDRIRAVFAESSVNPRLVENLVNETGVRLGGTLYADGLGPAGSGAEDYVSMYTLNVRTILDALAAP